MEISHLLDDFHNLSEDTCKKNGYIDYDNAIHTLRARLYDLNQNTHDRYYIIVKHFIPQRIIVEFPVTSSEVLSFVGISANAFEAGEQYGNAIKICETLCHIQYSTESLECITISSLPPNQQITTF